MAKNYKIVPDSAMFDAFKKESKPSGNYTVDSYLFDEFQRGWKAAIEWVNKNAVEGH